MLVVGGGFLGTTISDELNFQQIDNLKTSFTQREAELVYLDIRSKKSIIGCFEKIKPELVINCAAMIDIEFLENNPNVAFSTNSDGPKNLAEICDQKKIKMIQISTDGIFDGKKGMYVESDKPNPINIYAESKVLGEQFVQENLDNHVIIRTNFYGVNSEEKFLFNWMLNMLKNKKEFSGFDDIIFNPLEISTLSKMIIDVAKTDFKGILNLSSDEIMSKYEFAKKIANKLNFNENLIKKGSIDDFKFRAGRPKNTTLNNSKAKQIINFKNITLGKWLEQIKTLNQ